jgi:hypothetical protein
MNFLVFFFHGHAIIYSPPRSPSDLEVVDTIFYEYFGFPYHALYRQ